MTDAMLQEVARVDARDVRSTSPGSKSVTDDGVRHLARLPHLRHLDLSGTAITDRGLAVLRELPVLETLSLVDDQRHRRGRRASRAVPRVASRSTLAGRTRATAPSARLRASSSCTSFASGNDVTDDGLALLHELPVLQDVAGRRRRRWRFSATTPDRTTCSCAARSPTAACEHLRGLDGLFALNLDDARAPDSRPPRSHRS